MNLVRAFRRFWYRPCPARNAQEALLELLALPDPSDLGPRRYRYTQMPDPARDPDVIERDLGTAYLQHVRQMFGQDISCVVRSAR